MNLHREQKAYGARLRKFKKQITHADLTAAANGASQDVELGTVPAGSVLMYAWYALNTQFTGGAASAVAMIVGFSGDTNGVIESVDVFGGTADGVNKKGTQGTGMGLPLEAATTINVNFTPDGAHSLLNLTAGDVEVELVYAVPDEATLTV